jgi:hypothetical protein
MDRFYGAGFGRFDYFLIKIQIRSLFDRCDITLKLKNCGANFHACAATGARFVNPNFFHSPSRVNLFLEGHG